MRECQSGLFGASRFFREHLCCGCVRMYVAAPMMLTASLALHVFFCSKCRWVFSSMLLVARSLHALPHR